MFLTRAGVVMVAFATTVWLNEHMSFQELSRERSAAQVARQRPELAKIIRTVGYPRQFTDYAIDSDGDRLIAEKSDAVIAGRYLSGHFSDSELTFRWSGFVPHGTEADPYSEALDDAIPYIEYTDDLFEGQLVIDAISAAFARRRHPHHPVTLPVAGIEIRAIYSEDGEPSLYRMLVAAKNLEQAPLVFRRQKAQGIELSPTYAHFAASSNLESAAQILAISALHHQHIEAQLNGEL
ncbi:MAG: hypothetical protein ABIP50_01365 [Candidatus Saccharimonadales bacterium]